MGHGNPQLLLQRETRGRLTGRGNPQLLLQKETLGRRTGHGDPQLLLQLHDLMHVKADAARQAYLLCVAPQQLGTLLGDARPESRHLKLHQPELAPHLLALHRFPRLFEQARFMQCCSRLFVCPEPLAARLRLPLHRQRFFFPTLVVLAAPILCGLTFAGLAGLAAPILCGLTLAGLTPPPLMGKDFFRMRDKVMNVPQGASSPPSPS